MSCVLRASGKYFDVDSFLKDSTIKPLIVYHRGESRFPHSNPTMRSNDQSGMNVSVSVREFDDLAGQVEDAIQFLLDNTPELRRLRDFPGVERMEMDFPVADRDVAVQRDAFPDGLISLLGDVRIGLVVSHYPPSASSSP